MKDRTLRHEPSRTGPRLAGVVLFALSLTFAWQVFHGHSPYLRLPPEQATLMLFSENAFYYAFFQDIVRADTWPAAIAAVTDTDTVEYPARINAIRAFNIWPEVEGAFAYRAARALGWTGDPFRFYVNEIIVFVGGGIFCAAMLARRLGRSWWCAVVALLLYATNWEFATRADIHPGLRENLGVPLLLLQILWLMDLLREPDGAHPNRSGRVMTAAFVLVTAAVQLVWPFSPFILTTQVGALVVAYWVGTLTTGALRRLARLYVASLLLTWALHVGKFAVLHSVFTLSVLALLAVVAAHERGWLPQRTAVALAWGGLLASGQLVLGWLLAGQRDSHVFAVLQHRLGVPVADLDALLYLLSPAFGSLPLSWIKGMTQSLLVPLAAIGIGRSLYAVTRDPPTTGDRRPREAREAVAQLVVLLGLWLAFAVMALLFQRMVAFATPLTIAFGGIAVGRLSRGRTQPGDMAQMLMGAVASASVLIVGWPYIRPVFFEQSSAVSPRADDVELVQWINRSTDPDMAITADMATSSLVRVGTGRRITFHPQFETPENRRRSRLVHRLFARIPPGTLHETLAPLHGDLIVFDTRRCGQRLPRLGGIAYVDMVERALNITPERAEPVFCLNTLDQDGRQYFEERYRTSNGVYRVYAPVQAG